MLNIKLELSEREHFRFFLSKHWERLIIRWIYKSCLHTRIRWNWKVWPKEKKSVLRPFPHVPRVWQIFFTFLQNNNGNSKNKEKARFRERRTLFCVCVCVVCVCVLPVKRWREREKVWKHDFAAENNLNVNFRHFLW